MKPLRSFLATLKYYGLNKNRCTASTSSGLSQHSVDLWLTVYFGVSYSTLSPESLAVVALEGLRRGRGCVEQQQHRKRVKALRANWNQMSEATGWGILTVEQERQRGKFTSP